METLNNLAYWLVGADMYIIDRTSTLEKDKKALILTGWLIALAVVVSTVIAVAFVTTFFESHNMKVFFGILMALFWANIVMRVDRSLFSEKPLGSLTFRILLACFTSAIISIPAKMMITDTQIENHITESASIYNQQLKEKNMASVDSIYNEELATINKEIRDVTRYADVEYIKELRLQKEEIKQKRIENRAEVERSIANRYRKPNYSTGNKLIAFLAIQKDSNGMNWLLIIAIFIFESSPCWLRVFYHNSAYLSEVDKKNKQLTNMQQKIYELNYEMEVPSAIRALYNEKYEEQIKHIKTEVDNYQLIERYDIAISEAFEAIKNSRQENSNNQETTINKNNKTSHNNQQSRNSSQAKKPMFDYQS